MERYLETKCPNCGAVMTIKDNCIECMYCGTQYVSIYAGSLDSDVATIKLDELLNQIEKNKKDFLIINGKVSSGDINEIIANSGLKVALEELKKGNYYSAGQYAQKASGIEAVRISFLAKFKSKNESYLQEKSLWANLKSSDIPDDLINSEAYGAFYSSFMEYCKQREQAALESNELINDYLFKYIFLDDQIKAISGSDIYAVLKSRANAICKKYPIFPEPWIALKLFDKSAVSRMICAFQNCSFNYDVLLNWSNNHFVSRYLDVHNENHVYKIIFSQNEVALLKNELVRRYSGSTFKGVACELAQKPNNLAMRKMGYNSFFQRIDNCFIVYSKKLNDIVKSVAQNYFDVADKYDKMGSNSCWSYAGIGKHSGDYWERDAWWFPTRHSKSKNEKKTFNNYGFPFSNEIAAEGKEVFLELLYEQMEITDNNLTKYEIVIDDAKVDFNPRGIFPQKKSIAQLVKITACW